MGIEIATMKTVGSRELKNRLGRYLGLVRKGEALLLTDRGRPFARIVPLNSSQEGAPSLEEVLKQLEAEGNLRLGSGKFKPFKPVRVKGKPLSKMILEDRD
jgi:prevent-host-death family protein